MKKLLIFLIRQLYREISLNHQAWGGWKPCHIGRLLPRDKIKSAGVINDLYSLIKKCSHLKVYLSSGDVYQLDRESSMDSFFPFVLACKKLEALNIISRGKISTLTLHRQELIERCTEKASLCISQFFPSNNWQTQLSYSIAFPTSVKFGVRLDRT